MKPFFSSVLLASLLSLVCSGCAHHRSGDTKPAAAKKKDPVIKSSLILEPADQAQYYTGNRQLRPDPTTTEAPPSNSADSVLAAQPVEAYPIQRYVDPTDPNVMHERHVVYRRPPQVWKLQPAPSQEVIVGPTVNSKQPQIAMYSQEMTAFLKEQQIVNESNRRAVEALLGATKDLQEDAIRRREAEAQTQKNAANEAKAATDKAKGAADAKPQADQQSKP